jgi:hypothetical protein
VFDIGDYEIDIPDVVFNMDDYEVDIPDVMFNIGDYYVEIHPNKKYETRSA